MSQHNLDLNKIVSERVDASLASREARMLRQAINAPLRDRLFTNVAGKIYWYLLSAPPSLRGRNFGVADNMESAEEAITKLLGTNKRVSA